MIIPKLYEDTRGKVKSELANVEHFSATIDHWTSRNMDSFMSFTIHWIDTDFALHSRSLQVSRPANIKLSDVLGKLVFSLRILSKCTGC